MAMENTNIRVVAGINLGLLLNLSTIEITTLEQLGSLDHMICEHVSTYQPHGQERDEWTD